MIAKLEVESNIIHHKFATLVTNVAGAMEKSGTSIESLKLFFHTCGMTKLADSVRPTDKVAEVFSKVTTGNYWTFFNYELLESVINTFCKEDESITVDLDSYITSFKSYCERRLYEVPAPSLKTDMPNSGPMLKFHIKLDKNFNVSVNDIKNIQHVISKLLDIKHLYLVNITAGCIELTFQCFKEFDAVFPVRKHEETVSMFTRCKIQSLYCDKYQLKLRLESDLVEEDKVEEKVEETSPKVEEKVEEKVEQKVEETPLKVEREIEETPCLPKVKEGPAKVEDTPPKVEEGPAKVENVVEDGPAKVEEGPAKVEDKVEEGPAKLKVVETPKVDCPPNIGKVIMEAIIALLCHCSCM